jgi:quercetin dioxygenase-like cupin family protein
MATTLVHHRWADTRPESVAPGIERQFITGDRITVARFELKRGGVVPRHAHEAEQMTCVLAGALKFSVDGRDTIVRAGDVLQIPSWLAHEVEVLEDASVIDVFSPVRQDWVDKTDAYFHSDRSGR